MQLTEIFLKVVNMSLTASISSRSDLASVSAELKDGTLMQGTLMQEGVRTCPAMVVFEWSEILPEGSETHVDVRFYNAQNKELKRD